MLLYLEGSALPTVNSEKELAFVIYQVSGGAKMSVDSGASSMSRLLKLAHKFNCFYLSGKFIS